MKRRIIIIVCTAGVALVAAWLARPHAAPRPDPISEEDRRHTAIESDAGRVVVQNIDAKIAGRRDYYRQLREQVSTLSEEQWQRGFKLTERSGAEVTDRDLLGQPYVASFFFSRCPSICVQQNDKVKLLATKFRDAPVRFVSITCDPEYDTPEVLSAYADRLGASKVSWLFLTGEWDYLKKVSAEVFFNGLHSPRFHIEKLLLIDERGQIIADYDWHEPEEMQALESDLRAMISAQDRLGAN